MDSEDRSLGGFVVACSPSSDMFGAAVGKFVKTVGKESLIPVPSLDEADRCRPFHVVVKKNRRWFWQSPRYESTPFLLHELLVTSAEFTDVKVATRPLTTYNKIYEFDVNGKTGAKLASLLDFEVDGSDTVSIEANFGDITKLEVDQAVFQGMVDVRQVDLKHDFIKQVRADPRKTLCVIVGAADVKAEASVHMHSTRKGEAREGLGKVREAGEGLGKVKVAGEECDVSIGDSSQQELTIPAGTPLAFNVCELRVEGDGKLELMMEKNSLGGFDDTDAVDGALNEGILEGMSLEEQFGPLLTLDSEDRQDLTNAVLNVCAAPADVETILKLLKDAQRSPGSEPAKPCHLKVRGQMADAQLIVEAAGCVVEASGSVEYPVEPSLLLDALRSLFEALMELDDTETLALHSVSQNYAYPLLHLLSSVLDETPVKTSHDQVAPIYAEPNAAQAFCETLGFATSEDGSVTSSDDNMSELEGAYRAVYALWWTEDKPSPPGGGFRCVIL